MSASLVPSAPRIILAVETRRGPMEERVPRLLVRAPEDARVWAFRAAVSRIRASIEEASGHVPDGAPWDVVERPLWDRRSGVGVALELATLGGTDREADLGLALLERVAGEIERRQAA